MDRPDHPTHCDKAGRFRLHPKRGWHAAYCIGPVCEPLLPGWDVTYPGRSIQVSAPGYATADFRVSAFARDGTNAVAGDLAGAWLKAAPLELLPLRLTRNAECGVRNTEPRYLGCYEFMVGPFRQAVAQASPPAGWRTVSVSGGETPPEPAGGDACATLNTYRWARLSGFWTDTPALPSRGQHRDLPISSPLNLCKVCRGSTVRIWGGYGVVPVWGGRRGRKWGFRMALGYEFWQPVCLQAEDVPWNGSGKGPAGLSSEPLYAGKGGTQTRRVLGTSVKPSMCWQVRIQMAWLGFGTP